MKASDITRRIVDWAPVELSYQGDEPNFVWGDPDKEVKTVGVTWRPTIKSLIDAIEMNVDLLVIHEPLLQKEKAFIVKPELLTYPPNHRRKELLTKGDLAVYRAHSNWDDAEKGNNATLAEKLGLNVTGRLPYGRFGSIEPISLADFIDFVKVSLNCPQVLVVGDDLDIEINRVATISGGGNALTDLMEYAKQLGADVMVSGDIQDSRARFAKELGLAVIDAGGYYTETPGMKRLAGLLGEAFPELQVVYIDPGAPWQVG